MNGKIKMINHDRGFGFITADGNDYFFHRDDLADGPGGFHDLYEDDAVTFEELSPIPPKGRRATIVRREGAASLG